MQQRLFLVFTALAGLGAPAAWAQVPPPAAGLSWQHNFQDWVLACDNLRHCEAQGYQAENSQDPPVMLRLQREAGPGSMPRLGLAFGSIAPNEQQTPPQPQPGQALTLSADGVQIKLTVPTQHAQGQDLHLSPEHARALLPALRQAQVLELRQGRQRWRVSLQGASAALLKMDDLQGRLGTPGALLRPGNKPEAMPPAPALPVVSAQRLPVQAKADAGLRASLYQAVRALPGMAQTCPRLAEDASGASSGEVWQLPSGKVLVMFNCWLAAYNAGSGLWQANAKPPHAPQEVNFASLPAETQHQNRWAWLNQPSDLTLERSPEGLLQAHSAAKGRGIGDCWSSSDWVWNGQFFELTAASASACKLFEAGGAMQTLWRASVR